MFWCGVMVNVNVVAVLKILARLTSSTVNVYIYMCILHVLIDYLFPEYLQIIVSSIEVLSYGIACLDSKICIIILDNCI